MSQIDSAVHLGAADSPIDGAHRKAPAQTQMHDADDPRGEATAAMNSASLDLESKQPLLRQNDLDPPSPLNKDSPHDTARPGNHAEACVTSAPNPTSLQDDESGSIGLNTVAPPSSTVIVPPQSPLPRDTSPRSTPPSTNTLITAPPQNPPSPDSSHQHPHHTISVISSLLHKSHDGAAGSSNAHEGKMIFGHGSGGSGGSSAHRRRLATGPAMTDYEADLTLRDRARMKEAVKRYLADKVKSDWTWEWPRPEPIAVAEDNYSLEPPQENPESPTTEQVWKERDEWLSDESESKEDLLKPGADSASTKESPFRFESPDTINEQIIKSRNDRKYRRKKRLAEEIAWNDGTRCFVERRDAWTGARRVPRTRVSHTGSPMRVEQIAASEGDDSSTANDQDDESDWFSDTEVPIAPPILPPENLMRASITPSNYNTIYDKIVLQSLSPSCPMNLKDVTRSCVQGWKRDGEWPPKSTEIPRPAGKKGRKMSVASLFGFEKHEAAKEKADKEKEKAEAEKKEEKSPTSGGIRRSIQKIFRRDSGSGINHEHANTSNGKTKETEGKSPTK